LIKRLSSLYFILASVLLFVCAVILIYDCAAAINTGEFCIFQELNLARYKRTGGSPEYQSPILNEALDHMYNLYRTDHDIHGTASKLMSISLTFAVFNPFIMYILRWFRIHTTPLSINLTCAACICAVLLIAGLRVFIYNSFLDGSIISGYPIADPEWTDLGLCAMLFVFFKVISTLIVRDKS